MRAIVIGALVALAAPASAAARGGPVTPPGNSAVNQYVEIVPTAAGGRPSSKISVGGGGRTSGGPGGGTPGATAVAPSTGQALARQGAVGIRAAAIARATAPARVHGISARTASRRGPKHAVGTTLPSGGLPAPRRSTASEVLRALTGGATHGGLGVLMPALLLATVLGGVTLAIRRRREST